MFVPYNNLELQSKLSKVFVDLFQNNQGRCLISSSSSSSTPEGATGKKPCWPLWTYESSCQLSRRTITDRLQYLPLEEAPKPVFSTFFFLQPKIICMEEQKGSLRNNKNFAVDKNASTVCVSLICTKNQNGMAALLSK